MSLLVSIHDATPAFADEVMGRWEICAARSVRPALLVVPDWHGRWPLEAHPVFVAWPRTRDADGADIVLHGERHDEARLPRIAFHPQDLGHPAAAAALGPTPDRWLARHRPIPYTSHRG